MNDLMKDPLIGGLGKLFESIRARTPLDFEDLAKRIIDAHWSESGSSSYSGKLPGYRLSVTQLDEGRNYWFGLFCSKNGHLSEELSCTGRLVGRIYDYVKSTATKKDKRRANEG